MPAEKCGRIELLRSGKLRELKVVRSGEISAGGGWEMYAESGMGVGKKSCAEVLRGLREKCGHAAARKIKRLRFRA